MSPAAMPVPPASRRARWSEGLALAGLALLTLWWWRRWVRPDAVPFEDAAMLMRYAGNLARGAGIVWNPGAAPVDGATDFLFMVLVAGVSRLGLSLEASVRLLDALAHGGLVLLLYRGAWRGLGTPRPAAWLAAATLALGPGVGYAQAYFGTPVFALAVGLTAWSALRLGQRGPSWPRCLGFAAAGLFAGLVRPEGAVLAMLMALAAAAFLGGAGARRLLTAFVAVFGILGGAYFLWRWSYFGHPLPNPFYKKGGGHFYAGSLRESLLHGLLLCGPWLALLPLQFISAASRRRLWLWAVPAGAFILLWGALSNEMNFLMRFQYPVLGLVLLGAPLALAELPASAADWLRRHPASLAWWAALVLAWPLAVLQPQPALADSRAEVAAALRPYAADGLGMAVTEAGLLPYGSGWRALDAWGLNDAVIARRGRLDAADLAAFDPAVIMAHIYGSPLAAARQGSPWDAMCATLDDYAAGHGYLLAAAYGPGPFETHSYWVKPGLPQTPALLAAIRGRDYRWYGSDARCFDFAALGKAR